jgi:hypothetical protein
VDVEHTLTHMLRLPTERYIKRVHPQCVDVVAIRKISSIEEDGLKTDVHSTSSGVDAIERHEVLRMSSVVIVSVLMRYRVSFSTAAIIASSLAGVRTVCERPEGTCVVVARTVLEDICDKPIRIQSYCAAARLQGV